MSQPSSEGTASEWDALAKEAWNRALHTFGTAYIFEVRARLLRRRLKWLNFVALVVPVIVGGLALGYGAGFPLLGLAVAIGGTVGLVQLTFSTWAIVSGWVESYGYAITSVVDNQRLTQEFKELASNRSISIELARHRYEVLVALDSSRQAQDYSQDIKEQEKRMGMRAALRDRQLACSSCRIVPTSMEPTECAVCGNFKLSKV
ncbi:mobilome CxxCx(11)CxxC protein [Micromonospora sp. WMMD1274]|uniref:mobilome CxxCx(11)CxxC protein n=1 Tax=Micromonospora sp. WMMD1274 TaxID=3404116 RepID=UPI003B94E685